MEDTYIGLKLKDARIKAKLTIDEVADKLNIRKAFIKAIEEGNLKELPGETYALGFVRSYAHLLGLSPDNLMDRIGKIQETGINVNSNVNYAEGESALPSGKLIIIALVILICGYFVWYKLSAVKPEESTGTTISSAEPTISIENTGSQTAATTPATPQEDRKQTVPAATHTEVRPAPMPVVEQQPLPPVVVLEESYVPRRYGRYDAKSRIRILATEGSWMKVIKDGEVAFGKELLKGDSFYFEDFNDDITFDLGNAGGVEIYLDGKALKPFGAKNQVKRAIPLNEDTFTEYAR